MTWTDAYAVGDPVRVRYQGGWASAQVVAVRSRSCMVVILRGNSQVTANIHDQRNIECPKSNRKRSTLSEPQSSVFGTTPDKL